jgi:hypothetical protein
MKNKRLKTQATDEELLACMDYLHGDVVDHEFEAACCYEYARESPLLREEAACCYEYARESPLLREAARLWAAQKKDFCKETVSNSELDGEIVLKIETKSGPCSWLIEHPWSLIVQCPSFRQQTTWKELSHHARAHILLGFRRIPALCVDELWLLEESGILEELRMMAAKAHENERLPLPKTMYPIIEGAPMFGDWDTMFANLRASRRLPQAKILKDWPKGWPKERILPFRLHVMFTLDFTATKKRLLEQFDKWLQLPENKARFHSHGRKPIGTTGVFKDRLKDLAAWRLYRALGCKEALAFAEKNRKRDKNGRPRQFHDARREQSKTQCH